MNPDNIFNYFKITENKEALAFEWDKTASQYPGNSLPFLSEDFIKRFAPIAGLNIETVSYILNEFLPLVKKTPQIARLLWHLHHIYKLRAIKDNPYTVPFPQLENTLGKNAFTFNMIIALSLYPQALELHKKLEIPIQITNDTLSDMSVWCELFRKEEDAFGISTRILSWMTLHISGQLFRLGRLQFIHKIFKNEIYLYKNISSGKLSALAPAEMKIGTDGLSCSLKNMHKSYTWTTTFENSEDAVSGFPISQDGHVLPQKKTLSLSEWETVLQKGDSLLDIHIPAIGPMTPEACAESFAKAIDFFGKFFHEYKIKAFMCSSWLLDPAMEKIMPPHSNILNFKHLFHLFPMNAPSAHKETIWRIFGKIQENTAIEDYPQKSSMQKAAVNFLKKGGNFREAGGILLKENLPVIHL